MRCRGFFFLVDDAFRTGEYVEIEGTMGTVEKISIRSMQLRHHKGPVHTIPGLEDAGQLNEDDKAAIAGAATDAAREQMPATGEEKK